MPGLFARLNRFRPSRPRHPVLRVVLALLGVVLLALLLAGGIVIGLGMLAFRGVQRLRRGPAAKARAGVLDAEYRVVNPRAVPQSR